MSAVSHHTLRRKVGAAPVNRPPLRNVAFVSDLFARLLEDRLRISMRAPVVVTVEARGVATLAAATQGGGDAGRAMFALATGRDGAFAATLGIDGALLDQIIAVTFGASAGPEEPTDLDRPPTAIDRSLARPFVVNVLECFEAAVARRGAGRGAIAFSRFCGKPGELTARPSDVDVMSFHIAISFEEPDGGAPTASCAATLAVSLGALDAFRSMETSALSAAPAAPPEGSADAVWAAAMKAAAQAAEYRLIAVLQDITLSVEEVGALQPGDVIPLPERQRMEVDLRLDGPHGVSDAPTLARGALGGAEGQRAVKIVTPPEPAFIDSLRPYVAGADEA